MNKYMKIMLMVLGAGALLGAAAGGYFYLNAKKAEKQSQTKVAEVKTAEEKALDEVDADIKISEDLDLTEMDTIIDGLSGLDTNAL